MLLCQWLHLLCFMLWEGMLNIMVWTAKHSQTHSPKIWNQYSTLGPKCPDSEYLSLTLAAWSFHSYTKMFDFPIQECLKEWRSEVTPIQGMKCFYLLIWENCCCKWQLSRTMWASKQSVKHGLSLKCSAIRQRREKHWVDQSFLSVLCFYLNICLLHSFW